MAQHTIVHATDNVHFFMNELCARIVAKTGIPTDIYHLGKIILQGLEDAPDFVLQIDGATEESETNASVLPRTIRCASAFKKLGLVYKDAITLMAPNHLDVGIAFYAALCLGVTIAPIDTNLGVLELEAAFKVNQPKIILCQAAKTPHVQTALKNSHVDTTVITFDECDGFLQFRQLLDMHGGDEKAIRISSKPNNFDPAETIAIITATSGTTGAPKGAALTHKNLRVSIAYCWLGFTKFPMPTRMILLFSPLQWFSAIMNFLFSPILRFTRLQSSKPMVKEEIYKYINKYRPTYIFLSPSLARTILTIEDSSVCDFSCIEFVSIGGSSVTSVIIDDIKRAMPQTRIGIAYGQSEIGGFAFIDPCLGNLSVGKPLGHMNYRLVDVETGKDISKPNTPGELYLKGPTTFKGYFNNPEATAEVYEDGWLKTGDVLYRDEDYNYYFVDRFKQLLKYKNYQVSPTEIEIVIKQHPGVFEVAVTGISDPECGDLPVACIIRKPGQAVTAQEIKDLVKDTLSDPKQLRGGVVFLTEFPMTASMKINRKTLKEMIPSLLRE